ncbi:MAG TPA: acetoacetate--CoA ligase [Pseudonocardiaceae bacterium]
MATAIEGTGPRELLWTPSEERMLNSRMAAYLAWVNRAQHRRLVGYDELWRWSVDDLNGFWCSIWEWFGVIGETPSTPPTTALDEPAMPGADWFPGSRLNFTENVLRHGSSGGGELAIVGLTEASAQVQLSWAELTHQVASVARGLRRMGVGPGDRVAAYLPNIPQAVVALLAAAAVGAVWSCCHPELGAENLLDRLRQIEPVVLIAADGHHVAGRDNDRLDTVRELRAALPSLRETVLVRHLRPAEQPPSGFADFHRLAAAEAEPSYQRVPFRHPLWILHGSGTTGLPSGFMHSHGGILLEHVKAHGLHRETGPDDRVFIYPDAGRTDWNVLVTALSVGATIVTYDGSPTAPTTDALFRICSEQRVTRFGTAAAYLTACERAGIRPGERHDLSALRSITCTGPPLPDSTWHWVYRHVKRDLLLESDCGDTSVCTTYIGANPLLPVYAGELPAPFLGVRVEAWSPAGQPVVDEAGDLVVTAPMPSMPVSLWNDPDGRQYRDAYLAVFPGVWRTGDAIIHTRYGSYVVIPPAPLSAPRTAAARP